MKKSRVLMVAGYLPGYEGITSYLITLTKELLKAGWDVALVSDTVTKNVNVPGRADLRTEWIEALGIQHFYIAFPKFRRGSIKGLVQDLASIPGTLVKLYTAIQVFKPDIIHIHSLSVSPFVQIVRLLHKIPFASTCHQQPGTVWARDKLGVVFNQYFNTLFGDRCIALSKSLKDYFVDTMRVPIEQVKIVYSGIDAEHFRPPSPQERLQAREIYGLTSDDARVLCMIASLQPRKGHDTLLHAIAHLRATGLDVIVLLAGVGGAKDDIQAKAVEMGIGDLVRLLGFVDPRHVLWASDIVVLPSWQEAFPLVTIEAMLCKVVPIRTPASGATEQIKHGVTGFIFPFGDHKALALHLRQLFEDDTLRLRMAQASLELARENFTLTKMTEDLIAVYEELIPT